MQPATRRRALQILTALCSLLATAALGLAAHLIHTGAHPPPGGGSLGHVGMVVAGIGSAFAAFVFALLALYTRQRIHKRRAPEP